MEAASVAKQAKYQAEDDPALQEKVQEWLRLDQNPDTRKEIEDLVKENNHEELSKRLKSRMQFGTAGLRSKMGAGFSRINDLTIIQASQGLCRYVEQSFPNIKDMGVIIGHDARHNSERLAERTAAVFLSQGIKVYLFSSIVPTPFVPYGVRKYGCGAGVMITASHNPKDDNGYKVYFDNGSQIISPHDKNISRCIEENLEPWEQSWQRDHVRTHTLCIDPYQEVFQSYFEDIKDHSRYSEENSKSQVKITYTAMHGVGYKFAVAAFEAFCLSPFIPVKEQITPDPEFPTVTFPNPEEGKSALNLSIKTANEHGSKVILANDPDADRLGVAEKTPEGSWHILNGNEIGTLIGWWAFHCHKVKNPEAFPGEDVYMLASTVSSRMLNAMATAEGFKFEETLTGFKWMGNRAHDLTGDGRKVIFAYEEAIGFMYGSKVLDKDGVSAAAVLGEMISYLNRQGLTLLQQLENLYQKYGYHATNNSYFLGYHPPTVVKMFERIRTLEDGKYPSTCGPYKITGIRDLTAGHDSHQPDNVPILPVSKSTQMITFTFENGGVITVRTSGTEPKIKYYTELACKPGQCTDKSEAKNTLQHMVDCMIQEFLQPDVNNFISKTD